MRSLTAPFLNWSGKAERSQLSIPTLPLFVHERHSTKAVLDSLAAHQTSGASGELFGSPNLDISEQLEAYEHKGPWVNRLVLGDSLRVMNSLLEYEGMGSQVKMIYFDPPYGVRFGSNFQPFVKQRKAGQNGEIEISREPEMVKAYRDTWELGIHSYLTYLRDRILLARELLDESGSIFVQISDENVHHVREILSEIFGEENYLSTIIFKKKGATEIPNVVNDYILWAAKDRKKCEFRNLYYDRPDPEDYGKFSALISSNGEVKRVAKMPPHEIKKLVNDGWKWARVDYTVVSQDYDERRSRPYVFDGEERYCGEGAHWRFSVPEGMDRLAKAGRLFKGKGKSLGGIVYWSDWPYVSYNNVWTDVHGASNPIYVVQTNHKVIERCMLMATNPGDLVIDITCGSGTTPVVAERWGRRWIACDTSRIPIALARQRVLTETFPWYKMEDQQAGPAGGFVYERNRNNRGEEVGGLVPRIKLKCIANNEEPEIVKMVHKPAVDRRITRIAGPFTVEATVRAATSIDAGGRVIAQEGNPRAHIDRMLELLRQSRRLQLPQNMVLELADVRRLASASNLHAECISQGNSNRRIAICIGPEHAAVSSDFVFDASMEAMQNGFQQLFIFGFAIQANAQEMLHKVKPQTSYISVSHEVVSSDLLKTDRHSQIFSVAGMPDIVLERADRTASDVQRYSVVLRGLDICLLDQKKTRSIGADALPCWMLDTNYNDLVFLASQVFFPKTNAWDNLQKSLKTSYAPSVWRHLAGNRSEPFTLGKFRRIAVKVIDNRGNELMATRSEEEAHGH